MANVEVEMWRKEHAITVSTPDCPDPVTTFSHALMDKLPSVHDSFKQQGFKSPTPIQAQAWPILFKGDDMIGIAKTGSGKTIAFIVPALQRILKKGSKNDGPLCVVLAPTRELAQQIEAETAKVLPRNVTCTVLYGGVPKGPQIEAIRNGAQIVVATPGRLIDLMQSNFIKLSNVEYLVLDEADRMLDLGFEPDVRKICIQTPASRQTLMFSATWPEQVQNLARAFQRPTAIRVNVGGNLDELTANKAVTQHFCFVRNNNDKLRELTRILNMYKGRRVLVFALYKKSVSFLENQLRTVCGNLAAISSDKSQQHRERTLDKFRSEKDCVLVATDVAARGLDVKELEVVVNYEFPILVDDYVHRIGRTGRAGATGDAFTILADKEDYYDGFAASSLKLVLEQAGQEVPKEIAAFAHTVGNRTKVKKKEEKIPDFVSLVSGGENTKSTKFADSDSDDDEVPAKKHRSE